ncbi:MAG: peptide-methionine (S)-S-oxide reductase MsrA [Flavobacteriaceae bacterium]|nr:peptide-methionine (S)-S-oxide reductase MsrA [Bacteroidia bacterium]MBT8286750.1 peptide-methionine (S)-S-oxide reductase MsrA [Bacteroidia bacterium]NNF75239.1 peptide-methionine (S)-S-oxide reductase MsrA [Flavobacteriaceae bacterium]NNK74202.1 peptide-methionine (S)-S-oxide reductase MsrA [Flavobacteriaceae bacterium]
MAKHEIATFGGGCFWCVEAIFQEVKGIDKVVSGYSGGSAPGKPTYREICSGLTGHAEVIQVTYDPEVISFEEILIIFMTTHDPTTLNRQGADVGTQYRSVIYYHDDHQKETAETVIEQLQSYFEDPIITELSPLEIFYEAEEYHQNYYRSNQSQGYCSFVITPKLQKLRKLYKDKLK